MTVGTEFGATASIVLQRKQSMKNTRWTAHPIFDAPTTVMKNLTLTQLKLQAFVPIVAHFGLESLKQPNPTCYLDAVQNTKIVEEK